MIQDLFRKALDTYGRISARPRGLRPALPQAVPGAASRWWSPNFGTDALPFLTEPVVLGLPAAWRAVRLIANGVATMSPPRVYLPDERTLAGAWPIVDRPNPLYGTGLFFYMGVAHAITTGNFVCLLADPDPVTGYPRQAVPVPTQMVNGYFDRDGFPRYDIGTFAGLTADEVLHVRAHVTPGQVMGIGVVEAFRRAVGTQLHQQVYASNTYVTGGVPSGVITVPYADPTEEQVEDVQARWIDRHGEGSRKPATLPDGWKFEPLSWSPEDMEFLASRSFSVAEMAHMFDLDPSDLGAAFATSGSNLTYANLSQRLTQRTIEAYGPWCQRFEEVWTDLTPGANVVRFQRGNLTNASRADHITELAAAKAAGLMTADEGRMELRLPALTDPTETTDQGVTE